MAIAINNKTAAISGVDTLTNSSGSAWVPTGVMHMYGGSSAPTGWLMCDGTAVSRTTYAALFAVTGTSFGVGNGSTTFNLPDLRGRSPIGAGTGTGLTARVLGTTYGAETVTLAAANLPTHTTGNESASHIHQLTTNAGSAAGSVYGLLDRVGNSTNNLWTGNQVTSSAHTHTYTNASPTGVANIQPSIGVNYIIKT